MTYALMEDVTTDGSLNLSGKKLGLFTKVQDSFNETYPNRQTFVPSLHYIHQEVLCRTASNVNHVRGAAVKLVNFI
jgi:hypothetical protein